MNPAVQCFILLLSVVVCTSMTIKNCQCVKTSTGVKHRLIADVKEYPLRPYCNKVEVIARLKDNSLVCLDPTSRFTKIVLQVMRKKEALAKTNAIASSSNTTSAAASASAGPTPW
ncbi:interleukin-8-like isoform 2-T2 [Odontesthes bonariensis]|uniref:interleukin-8-like isoform X2 n=1 Tax=Odontesthes bonariensis TaxID=219752 RepID=UPI003F581BE7